MAVDLGHEKYGLQYTAPQSFCENVKFYGVVKKKMKNPIGKSTSKHSALTQTENTFTPDPHFRPSHWTRA